ncbi:MAG TPA: Uma2 family endonuclease [Thermoanaerobaculia bacterium]|jgi:Uma2 family endonuclease
MTQSALALARPDEPIEYPESDGEPMAETDEHRDEMTATIQTLEWHFRARQDVYVSGNLFFYYEEGNPRACKAPDVFVVTGVPKKKRRTYKLWEEGEVPALVIEVTSKKTKKEDEVDKPELYAELGIPYLFVYDPCAEYLKPPLQGFELGKRGKYRRIAGARSGPFPCPPLDLAFFLDERGRLQILDTVTGEPVRRMEKALEASEAALVGAEAARVQEKLARLKVEGEWQQEAEARRKAEGLNRHLMAEIERLRAQVKGG